MSGAAIPIVLAVGQTAIIRVLKAMSNTVAVSVARRPTLSAYPPNIAAPKGRARKPTPNVKNVAMSEAN